MAPRCLDFEYWVLGFSAHIGVTPKVLLNNARAELAKHALTLPGARVGSALIYPALPSQAAAVMAQFLRHDIVRFVRFHAAEWTTERFLELNAAELRVPRDQRAAYQALLDAVSDERASEEELASFLEQHIVGLDLMIEQTETLMLFVGAPVEPDCFADKNDISDLFAVVERAARVKAKALVPPVDLFATYPARAGGDAATAWTGTTRMLWGSQVEFDAGGMMVLDVDGGSSSLGLELLLAGFSRPVLWLIREGQEPPLLVAGYAKEADVRICSFGSDEALADHVAEFIEDKAARMLEIARERQDAPLLNLGPQIRLRRRWMALTHDELLRVSAACQMRVERIIRILADPRAFDQAITADLRRLANALGTTLSEVFGSDSPPRLSVREEHALLVMSQQDGLSATEALRLRGVGEARLARPNAIQSLVAPDGWRRLRATAVA